MTTPADLEAMDRDALASLWKGMFGTRVPAQMSQLMQRRFLAYALQVQVQGDVPATVVARLDRMRAGEARSITPRLKPGARLLRAWNGTTHVVDVVSDGYLWNGTVHGSLSAIARAITGARWSGPRFFGLLAGSGADDGRVQGKSPSRKVRDA